jgi:hypothetical protein
MEKCFRLIEWACIKSIYVSYKSLSLNVSYVQIEGFPNSRQILLSLLWMINGTLNHRCQYWKGRSRDTLVGTSTRLRTAQLKNRGATLGRSRGFYVLSLLTGFGSQTASCSAGTVSPYPWVKWPGREVHHLPSSSAEVKNGGSLAATYLIPSWP